MTSLSGTSYDEARAGGTTWGRMVESAVGAHLVNAAQVAGDRDSRGAPP